jgi:hypothetical protein
MHQHVWQTLRIVTKDYDPDEHHEIDSETFEFQVCELCPAERIYHHSTLAGYGFYLKTDER